MRKKADSSVEMHPILAERWSPRSFNGDVEISIADLTGILEAARWAPSSMNSQPWRFVVARRGDHRFAQLIDSMGGFNKVWSPKASALVLVTAKCDIMHCLQRPQVDNSFHIVALVTLP